MPVQRNTRRRNQHRATIAADEPPCYICGDPIDYDADPDDPDSFQIEHVTPLDLGGEDELDNIAPAHRRCNREKSNKPAAVVYETTRTWEP